MTRDLSIFRDPTKKSRDVKKRSCDRINISSDIYKQCMSRDVTKQMTRDL